MTTRAYGILQERGARLANQMMIGHGAALLVIFNVSARGEAVLGLRIAAVIFAVGLVAAFVVVFSSMMHDVGEAALAGPEKFEPHDVKMLFAMQDQAQYAFLISGAAFVIGLITGISML